MLISDVVAHGAQHSPDAPALIFHDRLWTFAELDSEVNRYGQWVAANVPAGQPIAVISDNRPEMLLIAYAAPSVGVPVVFGNTRLNQAELTAILAPSNPVLVMGPASDEDTLHAVAAGLPGAPEVLTFESLDRSANELSVSSQDGARPNADDVAWLIHTSGTTGPAKTVMLTHRSLLAGVLNTALDRPMTATDTYLFCFPLFHVAAYNVIHAHLRRAAVVLLPKFEARSVADAIATHHVTMLSLAPTMVSMLLDLAETDAHMDLSTIHTIAYGAAAMSTGLLRRASEAWGCGFAQGYGMTELSGNAVFLSPDDHRRALDDRPELLNSAGRPGPLVAVRITDTDGTDCPAGQPGEILIRGDQVAAGYLHQPNETAAAFVDGWMHTGDIGYLDGSGYLFIVDRLKDIVITGGENVASREVEDAMSLHPNVQQVAVIGLPDDRWGEVVCAVVIARTPPSDPAETALFTEELITWGKQQLSGFKAPKRIVFADSLPLNASGKVLKSELRSRQNNPPR